MKRSLVEMEDYLLKKEVTSWNRRLQVEIGG